MRSNCLGYVESGVCPAATITSGDGVCDDQELGAEEAGAGGIGKAEGGD